MSRISSTPAAALIIHELVHSGISIEDAMVLTESVIWNERCGHPEYGLSRLEFYKKGVASKEVFSPARSEVSYLAPSVAVLSGGFGLGPVLAEEAVSIAEKLADEFGVGLCLVRESSHIGSLGYYLYHSALRGYATLMGSNSFARVACPGGANPVLGTNPLAFSCPKGPNEVVVADLATSMISNNTAKRLVLHGKEFPQGSAVSNQGIETVSPTEVSALLPLGGAKGFCLGLIVEILSAAMSGASFAAEIGNKSIYSAGAGHFVICLGRSVVTEEVINRVGLLEEIINSENGRFPGSKLKSIDQILAEEVMINDFGAHC